MRCIAPYCNNDSKENSTKTKRISFHLLPTEPTRRSKWLKALGVTDNLSVKERFHVCSDHFNFEDLYETKNGVKKLKNDAEPVYVELHSSNHLPVCRICLSTESLNGNLVSMNTFKVENAYEVVTGISISKDDKLPQHLCMGCTHRLFSCFRFKSKSLRANSLLLELVDKYQALTLKNIVSIDRDKNRLTSALKVRLFSTNYCDSHVIDKGDEMDDEKADIPLDDVVKLEDDQIFINEYTEPIKEEIIEINDDRIDNVNASALDNANGINDITLDNIKENVFTVNDKDTDNESGVNDDTLVDVNDNNDLVIDEDLNGDYSSDDNIPLKFQRKVKKGKTKKAGTKKVGKKKVNANKVLQQIKVDRRRKPFYTDDDLNEILFTVTDLSFDEQVADIQKRQESSNFKNSIFKCLSCFKGFQDEDAYNSHMLRHTDKCGDHECDVCRIRFKQSHALRKHVTAHHTQRFSCNQCPFVTTHRQSARLHERWHKGTQYKCPHCTEVFQKFTTYMGHVRIKHPSDIVCALCGFSFVSAKGLDLHKKLKHRLESDQVPEDGPYCEPCNVRFVSEEVYRKHLNESGRHDEVGKDPERPIKRRHRGEMKEGDKDSGGDVDGKRKNIYPSQMRKAEGPIPCEQCGLELEDSRAYHSHFRKSHPDKNRTVYLSMRTPCMCEVCGRMFQSYALLKDHRWVHTGERPFACDACGKSFRMRQRLVTHRRVHSQLRTTSDCAMCGKSFSNKSNLKRHLFIHTGLKPFKCEMCGKGFKHVSEKRAHVGYVHLKKPWPKRTRAKRRTDRPGQGQLPHASAAGASEMDIAPAIWPPCDPKMAAMNGMMQEKPVYYNHKDI